MKNKEQVLVVPVNHVSHIPNGLSGTISHLNNKSSYCLFDSIGIYETREKIDNNICLVKIATVMLFKNNNNEYLVRELVDKTKRPCLELGINNLVKQDCGNNNALLNQMINTSFLLGLDSKTTNYNYIGHIRDLANASTKNILGTIYSVNYNGSIKLPKETKAYSYKWYDLNTLVNNYSKATNWSKELIDALLINKINI